MTKKTSTPRSHGEPARVEVEGDDREDGEGAQAVEAGQPAGAGLRGASTRGSVATPPLASGRSDSMAQR